MALCLAFSQQILCVSQDFSAKDFLPQVFGRSAAQQPALAQPTGPRNEGIPSWIPFIFSLNHADPYFLA